MTREERVERVATLGFTERQAGFLVTVLLHAGVCLGRQYCTYARITRGEKMYEFFRSLVERRYATAYPCGHNKARVYHLHHRRLYEAVGEPETRLRKSITLARAVERLIVLDHVLAHPAVTWFGTSHEKEAHFGLTTTVLREELPALVFGHGSATTVRYFPDRFPIGLAPGGRGYVFLYLVTPSNGWDFRAFLYRHGDLLRALPRWTIRLLIPRHLTQAGSVFAGVCREELASPLHPSVADELRWYFQHQNAYPEHERERFRRAVRAFGAPRFRNLYRLWRRSGDRVVDATVSSVLADAMERGFGRLERHVVPHHYNYLTPLVGAA